MEGLQMEENNTKFKILDENNIEREAITLPFIFVQSPNKAAVLWAFATAYKPLLICTLTFYVIFRQCFKN